MHEYLSFFNQEERSTILVWLQQISSSLPSLNFVIRPHPSESLDQWQSLDSIPNITVCNLGPVDPWVKKASAVMHRGSTVGYEAICRGIPSIYLHTPNSTLSTPPYPVSHIATSPEQAVEAIEKFLCAPSRSTLNINLGTTQSLSSCSLILSSIKPYLKYQHKLPLHVSHHSLVSIIYRYLSRLSRWKYRQTTKYPPQFDILTHSLALITREITYIHSFHSKSYQNSSSPVSYFYTLLLRLYSRLSAEGYSNLEQSIKLKSPNEKLGDGIHASEAQVFLDRLPLKGVAAHQLSRDLIHVSLNSSQPSS